MIDAENTPKPATQHVSASEGEATAFTLEDVHGYRDVFRRIATVALICTIVLFAGLAVSMLLAVHK